MIFMPTSMILIITALIKKENNMYVLVLIVQIFILMYLSFEKKTPINCNNDFKFSLFKSFKYFFIITSILSLIFILSSFHKYLSTINSYTIIYFFGIGSVLLALNIVYVIGSCYILFKGSINKYYYIGGFLNLILSSCIIYVISEKYRQLF